MCADFRKINCVLNNFAFGVVNYAVFLRRIDDQLDFFFGMDMFVGVLDILVGIIFVGNLGVSASSMPIIFALWCLAVGVIQLVVAYQFRKAQVSWGWTLTSGILGILFAFLILSYPAVGVITITALMGTYILLFGILEIAEYTTNNRSLVIEADNL